MSDMSEKQQKTYGWMVVGASFLALFVLFGYRSTFAVLKDPMLKDMGWTNAETTIGYSIMMTIYAISAFFCGMILDKWGTKPIFGIAALLGALGFYVTGQTHSLPTYCFAYGLFGGIATGMLWVTSTISVRKWYVGKDYAKMFGFAFAGAPLGQLILTYFIKNALADGSSWRTIFEGLGYMTFVVLVIGFFLAKRGPEAYGLTASGALPTAAGKAPAREYEWSIGQAFSSYPIWGAILTFVFSVLAEFLVWTQVVSYWRIDLGIDISTASYMYMVIGVVGIFSMPIMGIVADHTVKVVGSEPLGRKRMLQLGPSIGIIACILLFLQRYSIWIGVVSCVLFAIYWAIVPGGVVGYTGSLYGRKTLGKIWGLATLLVMGTGPFTGSFVGGYLKDVTGSYTASLVVALVSFLLSLIFATSLPLRLLNPEERRIVTTEPITT
ncbi:MAG: nitrate/nitrite transporter [Solidesulfovibrio sp.]